MERNEPCWCGSGKKYKKCHMPIDEKYSFTQTAEIVPSRAILKTPAQIEMIRKSADLNTAVLDEVAKHIRIGMSTAEIDEIVYRFTTEHGGIPAPLNYQGFPKSVCTSLNNEICHGIPDENIMIQDGDIINVDVSTILNGYFQMHPGCSRWEMSLSVPSVLYVLRKSASSGDLQPQSHGDIWATLPMPSIRTHRPMVIPL